MRRNSLFHLKRYVIDHETKVQHWVHQDNAKKKATKKLSSVSIDLSNFVTNSDPVVIPIGKNSKTAPLLHATFKTKALKYNTKMLVKVEPGSRTERDSRLVKKIIGEEYFLDRTDSDLSPTTMDTASVASDDESDFTFDADEASSVNNDNDVADSELRKRVDDLQQQLDAIEAESFERLTVIREKDKELATAQKRLAASERELADKTAQLEKQQEDKDELLTQLERLKKPAGRGEADTLRAEAVAHLSTINTLEKDIERLKREAKDREKEKDRDRDKDRENDRSKDKNKESEATILRLQQENDRLSKLLREKESAAETRPSYKSRAARDDDDDGERNGGLGGRLEMARKGASSSGDAKQMASLRQELEEKLLLEKSIYCVEPQLRSGLPISAGLIFEALQSWSSLQPQDKSYGNTGSKSITTVTAGIDLAIKRARYDNGLLCYWLATVITLLSKLRHKQESEWNGPSADALDSAASTMSPATRLEFSLTATLGKAYSMLVKNICLQLDPLLVPVMLYHHVMPRGTTFSSGAGVVVHMVDELYRQLQEYHVHNGLITQIFSQVLYYVDAVLFNALATRKDLCTCAHGFRVRLQVSRLEEWIPSAFVGVRDQLAPAVQAAKLLVMDKHLLGKLVYNT